MKPYSVKAARRLIILFIVFEVILTAMYALATPESSITDMYWFLMIFLSTAFFSIFVFWFRSYTIKRWKRLKRKLPEGVE